MTALLTSVLENARGAPEVEQADDGEPQVRPAVTNDDLPVPARQPRGSVRGEQIVLREITPGEDGGTQRTEISSVAASLLEAFQQPTDAGDDPHPVEARDRIEDRSDPFAHPDGDIARTNTLDDSGPLALPAPPTGESDMADPTVEITGRFANLPTVPLHPAEQGVDTARADHATADAGDDPTAHTQDDDAVLSPDQPVGALDDTAEAWHDTRADAERDASADARHHTSADAERDASPDARHDTSADAEREASPDARHVDWTTETDDADGITSTSGVDHATPDDAATDGQEILRTDDTGDLGRTPRSDRTSGDDGTIDEDEDPSAAGHDIEPVDAGDPQHSAVDLAPDAPVTDADATGDITATTDEDTATTGDIRAQDAATSEIAADASTTTGEVSAGGSVPQGGDRADPRYDPFDSDASTSLNGAVATADGGRDAPADDVAATEATTSGVATTADAASRQREAASSHPDDGPSRGSTSSSSYLPERLAPARSDNPTDDDPAREAGAWTTVAQVMLVIVGTLCVFQIVVLIVVYQFLGDPGADPTDVLEAHTKVTAVMLPALVGGTFAATAFAAWRAFSTPTTGLRLFGLPAALWAVLLSATLLAAVVLLSGAATIAQARQTSLWAMAACALLGMACIAAPRSITEPIEDDERTDTYQPA